MKSLIEFWTDLDSPVRRGEYLLHGVVLAAVKYAGDAALIWLATGTLWTPADYLNSVYSLLSTGRFSRAPSWLLPALGVWTLPFVWLGITLTMRRVLDAGRSCWWAFLFFVPYVNYGLMFCSAIAPTSSRAISTRSAFRSDTSWTAALASITVGVGVGFLAVAVFVGFFRDYGAALFFGVPFAMGSVTAFLFNRWCAASTGETLSVTTLMFVVSAGAAFLLATEGVICILMAMPIGLVTGIFGAKLGRAIARMGQTQVPPAFLALLALPLSGILEPAGAGRILHEVQTAIEIDAAPETVWSSVIAFNPIPEPTETLFRLGIAYPRYATIEGEGVGAVRYCVFSTGAFVEPITRWELGRRLSFDVVRSPDPLRELTMYKDVSPPHLSGYLRSKRGEFRLIPLPGGGTRLEGSTWYELEMAPEAYWQIFSDYLIARIHSRVLDHIKREVETAAR